MKSTNILSKSVGHVTVGSYLLGAQDRTMGGFAFTNVQKAFLKHFRHILNPSAVPQQVQPEFCPWNMHSSATVPGCSPRASPPPAPAPSHGRLGGHAAAPALAGRLRGTPAGRGRPLPPTGPPLCPTRGGVCLCVAHRRVVRLGNGERSRWNCRAQT